MLPDQRDEIPERSEPIPVSRFIGCLLGLTAGDSLGAPFEGYPADHVYWTSGSVGQQLDQEEERLAYTDDTQMTIAVAEALLEAGRIEEESLCRAFARNYQAERGYGQAARLILEAMVAGNEWNCLADSLLPGGSYGNGAAMRVAPIGLMFCHDLDRVMEEARLSALPTHRHPLGIEGAQLLAVAVAYTVRSPAFDRVGLYRELQSRCRSEEFRWQLDAALPLRSRHTQSFLGNSLPAHRSVVSSIACFTSCPRSFREVIERAISLGDDTDTLAAMAGALSGACLGMEGIPARWVERLEQGEKGAEYIRSLAIELHSRHLSLSQ